MRIILDTNLWISFLISSKYEQLDSLLDDEKCTLLFSNELLDEFQTLKASNVHKGGPHSDQRNPGVKRWHKGDLRISLYKVIRQCRRLVPGMILPAR